MSEASGDARTARVKLQNKHGLHARPAHLFVQTATAYASQLRVTRVGGDELGEGPQHLVGVGAHSL